MAYQLYTDKSSGGYSYLWGSNSTTANGGLRKYKEFYCVAMGSYYGPTEHLSKWNLMMGRRFIA